MVGHHPIGSVQMRFKHHLWGMQRGAAVSGPTVPIWICARFAFAGEG